MNNLDDSITESTEKFLSGIVVRIFQENLGIGNDPLKNATKKKEEKTSQERW